MPSRTKKPLFYVKLAVHSMIELIWIAHFVLFSFLLTYEYVFFQIITVEKLFMM